MLTTEPDTRKDRCGSPDGSEACRARQGPCFRPLAAIRRSILATCFPSATEYLVRTPDPQREASHAGSKLGAGSPAPKHTPNGAWP